MGETEGEAVAADGRGSEELRPHLLRIHCRGTKPVRYITSDLSVIDRAAVMDVSNVEVIYVVEEYENMKRRKRRL
ncbi:hypothetical protein EVAR_73334_1 [Eumeta japonica]|uniref:Uncharacterized protein n=1 Tax=Eumeta variegata TaxID=151549 RepID=A0A4C1TBK5_EUMVA|nr:hypothetical protein EVAR_73334_1 [Eumeta japonica]